MIASLVPPLLVLLVLGLPSCAQVPPPPAPAHAQDPDSDGDGLSDFLELHKYRTDPQRADSDGDGIPDGEWHERREFTYTVRSLVHVLPPVTPDVLHDDYQDARILESGDGCVELEVIHYPLNTVASSITANPSWRRDKARMREWLQPGPTANWDTEMQQALVAKLAADGIDAATLDDRTLVEKAAKWLLAHARNGDGFTTFCGRFVDGRATVQPGLEETVEREIGPLKRTVEEHWQRELFAKGMFEHGTRGSCTSTAIYLNGCLRALGIPTRIVLVIPIVDGSDARQVAWLATRLHHPRVARIAEEAIASLGSTWASHSFNEVFVGGRWRRLNGTRLGQDILDAHMFGLVTHVATFSDWADGNMAATWGLRQRHGGPRDDVFGGANPYTAIALSDLVGRHAHIDLDPAVADTARLAALTIERAYWYLHDPRPTGVDMRLDDEHEAGHVLVHVRECRGDSWQQFARFYRRVSKTFVLRADGQADVPLAAARGYWSAPADGVAEFYLRIEPTALRAMVVGVSYRLIAEHRDAAFRWLVADGVTLTRPPAGARVVAQAPVPGVPKELVVDAVFWSDAADSPIGPLQGMGTTLLLHVGAARDFPVHKKFTELTDRRFLLEAKGHPTVEIDAGVGGVTTGTDSYASLVLETASGQGIAAGVEYTIRPRNGNAGYQWKLSEQFRVRR